MASTAGHIPGSDKAVYAVYGPPCSWQRNGSIWSAVSLPGVWPAVPCLESVCGAVGHVWSVGALAVRSSTCCRNACSLNTAFVAQVYATRLFMVRGPGPPTAAAPSPATSKWIRPGLAGRARDLNASFRASGTALWSSASAPPRSIEGRCKIVAGLPLLLGCSAARHAVSPPPSTSSLSLSRTLREKQMACS